MFFRTERDGNQSFLQKSKMTEMWLAESDFSFMNDEMKL